MKKAKQLLKEYGYVANLEYFQMIAESTYNSLHQKLNPMRNKIYTGMKYKIADCSGLDSNKVVTVISPYHIHTRGDGVPTNVSGAYKPVDWKKEVAIMYQDGSLGTMFKSRLTEY